MNIKCYRVLIISLFFMIVNTTTHVNYTPNDNELNNNNNNNNNNSYDLNILPNLNDECNALEIKKTINNELVFDVLDPKYNTTIPLYDIDLPLELQKYVYNLSLEVDIDHKIILAVMWVESRFDNSVTNKNTNGTIDRGYMQLNSKWTNWQADLSGIDRQHFDVNNPYHNIVAGIKELEDCKTYWINKGINSENVLNYMLNSYNMGKVGFSKYINKYNTTTRYYDQQVKDYMKKLESLVLE